MEMYDTDDLAIYIRGTDFDQMVNSIQYNIDKLVTWYQERDLNFSTEKWKIVIFTRTITGMQELSGNTSDRSAHIKYLPTTRIDQTQDFRRNNSRKLRHHGGLDGGSQ